MDKSFATQNEPNCPAHSKPKRKVENHNSLIARHPTLTSSTAHLLQVQAKVDPLFIKRRFFLLEEIIQFIFFKLRWPWFCELSSQCQNCTGLTNPVCCTAQTRNMSKRSQEWVLLKDIKAERDLFFSVLSSKYVDGEKNNQFQYLCDYG